MTNSNFVGRSTAPISSSRYTAPSSKPIFTTYGLQFGEIPGEKQTLPPSVADLNCDYERTTGPNVVVEPRKVVRGDIARSLFYMHVEYELDLKGMLPMLKRWHATDPSDAHERWRILISRNCRRHGTASLTTAHWRISCSDATSLRF